MREIRIRNLITSSDVLMVNLVDFELNLCNRIDNSGNQLNT